jgi:hypothetical protein
MQGISAAIIVTNSLATFRAHAGHDLEEIGVFLLTVTAQRLQFRLPLKPSVTLAALSDAQ